MTNFNMFSYATIAEADFSVKRTEPDGTVENYINKLHINKPSFDSPRPCFGFIWSNLNQYVRTKKEFLTNYNTKIYINRNVNWAVKRNKKNYCCLTDDEIDTYLRFVSDVAGDKFTIECSDYSSGGNFDDFRGIVIHLKVEDISFKKVMIVCNMIRYMYEWPEAYNVKQMFAAYKNKLFFEDFGQIFCLYESYMRNQYDQHISSTEVNGDAPSFIKIYTTKELHDLLDNHDIALDACQFLRFTQFKPVLLVAAKKNADMWKCNKSQEYRSDLYLSQETQLDDALTKNISALYRYMIMDESISK